MNKVGQNPNELMFFFLSSASVDNPRGIVTISIKYFPYKRGKFVGVIITASLLFSYGPFGQSMNEIGKATHTHKI